MRDVYLNPTVRGLAGALQGEGGAEATAKPQWSEPERPEPVGTPRYLLCGALQLLTLLAYLSVAAVGFEATSSWVLGAHGALETYLRAVAAGAMLLFGTGLLPIAAKWILIGRFKPQSIRVWSLTYFRF